MKETEALPYKGKDALHPQGDIFRRYRIKRYKNGSHLYYKSPLLHCVLRLCCIAASSSTLLLAQWRPRRECQSTLRQYFEFSTERLLLS